MINLYRATYAAKTPTGFERIQQEGFTHSNNSEAQYAGYENDLIPWDYEGYNPDQKVEGLPVFLNLGEAKNWITGNFERRYDTPHSSLPIIAHARLPREYFKTHAYDVNSGNCRPSEEGILELRGNDCNNDNWPVNAEFVEKYQRWTGEGCRKLEYEEDPDGSISSQFARQSGEHYIGNYALTEIRRRYRESPTLQAENPLDFTRYYTPSLYLVDGTIPSNKDIPQGAEQFGPEYLRTSDIHFPLIELGLVELRSILVS